MEKKIQWVFVGLFVGALGALALSYYAEYGMRFSPCLLCKLQRGTYFAIGGSTILGLFLKGKKRMLRIIQLFLLIGLGVASYHTVIQFTQIFCGCGSFLWTLYGLPVPLYNSILLLILLIATQIFFIRTHKKSAC